MAITAALLAVITYFEVLPAPALLGTRILTNRGDPALLMWQLTTQSSALAAGRLGDLLQGNIFYPHRDALAYSDSLISYLPVFSPVLWLSHNPLLAYNVTLYIGYLGGALAMYALATHVLGRGWPPLVAAVVFTASPLRSATIDHLQLVGIAFALLALLFTMRLLEGGGWGDALGLGCCLGLAWLGTAYGAMMLALGLPVFVVAWCVAGRRRPSRGLVVRLAMASAVGGLVAAPTLPAYARVQAAGLERRADADITAVTASSFTTLPPSVLYQALHVGGADLPEQRALYPGLVLGVLVAWALAAAAVERRSGRSRPGPARLRGYAVPLVALALVEATVLVGPNAGALSLADRALRATVPGVASLRGLGRFWLLGVAALALVAGRGAGRLHDRLASPWRAIVLAAVVLVAPLETLAAHPVVGIALEPPRSTANLNLRTLPAGPVMEMPPVQPGPVFAQTLGPRMVRSTIDGLPRVEGRSGTIPPDVLALINGVRAFPDPATLDLMRAAGVRYVLVHAGPRSCADLYGPDEAAEVIARLRDSPAVQRVIPAGADSIIVLAAWTGGPAPAAPTAPVPPRPPYVCADP